MKNITAKILNFLIRVSSVKKTPVTELITFAQNVLMNGKGKEVVFVFMIKARTMVLMLNYYCPLCDEAHHRNALCKKCFEKLTSQGENKRIFFRAILPSLAIGIVIGFLLG